MFLVHLPTGYLGYRLLPTRLRTRAVCAAALVGSVLPDLDMVYFYLIDERQHQHHTYWSHIPFAWAVAGVVGAAILRVARRDWLAPWCVGIVSVLVHLVADTPLAGILWRYPLDARRTPAAYVISDIRVPDAWGHWVLNFLLHPTVLIEVAITAAAVLVYRRTRAPAATAAP